MIFCNHRLTANELERESTFSKPFTNSARIQTFFEAFFTHRKRWRLTAKQTRNLVDIHYFIRVSALFLVEFSCWNPSNHGLSTEDYSYSDSQFRIVIAERPCWHSHRHQNCGCTFGIGFVFERSGHKKMIEFSVRKHVSNLCTPWNRVLW